MERDQQSAPAPRPRLHPSQVDCWWWKKGHCFRGDQCYFRHDDALAGVDQFLRGPAAAASNIRTEAAVAETSEEQCGICMENPTIFGLLVNCDHVFCLDCIRSWRSSSVGTSAEDVISMPNSHVPREITKTCPLCRTKSEYVVPSSVFPTPPQAATDTAGTTSGGTGTADNSARKMEPGSVNGAGNPAKAKIIDKYLARLKATPCRYFEESIKRWRELPVIENPDPAVGGLLHPTFSGECLFGNECHFAHIHPVTNAPYTFTKKEIASMKRANHARRARAMRRAIRGQTRRMELEGMLETLSVEDGYESSATSLTLERSGLGGMLSVGFVLYGTTEGIPWLPADHDDDDDNDDGIFDLL
ncbi:zinc finger, C3HC4 type (RING finger) domain-containing protein [Histoplasma ohiense]|nr:zinc finger, C3HC4 type (RING finger) domain-containing protein [Histoplasma ohiense (nom. inval.)]